MRTDDEVRNARRIIAERVASGGLSDPQMVLLSGMSVALQWASGVGGKSNSLARLIDGEQLATALKDAYPEGQEKRRRIYYQEIVYEICAQLDRAAGKRPGEGIVCGTVDEPSTELQDAVRRLIAGGQR